MRKIESAEKNFYILLYSKLEIELKTYQEEAQKLTPLLTSLIKNETLNYIIFIIYDLTFFSFCWESVHGDYVEEFIRLSLEKNDLEQNLSQKIAL